MNEDFFRTRLTQLRMQKDISARDMSLSLGQNAGYINNIETGKALPSMASFFSICEFFNITPEEFFDSNSSMPAELSELIVNLKKLSPEQLMNISSIVSGLIR